MRLLLRQPWVVQITAVYCSTEQKAMDGAALLAAHLGLPVSQVADFGENDRSATGYLSAPEFEQVVDQFFAHPTVSVRGWEPAAVAQQRIVRAVTTILAQDSSAGAIAIAAHGGVGTLLLCALAGYAIDRRYEQPGRGGATITPSTRHRGSCDMGGVPSTHTSRGQGQTEGSTRTGDTGPESCAGVGNGVGEALTGKIQSDSFIVPKKPRPMGPAEKVEGRELAKGNVAE